MPHQGVGGQAEINTYVNVSNNVVLSVKYQDKNIPPFMSTFNTRHSPEDIAGEGEGGHQLLCAGLGPVPGLGRQLGGDLRAVQRVADHVRRGRHRDRGLRGRRG